jgi:cell division protein FtsA
MDCRIGTPNEHVAKSSENVTNPMFATGVGLVMMGLSKMEKEMKKQHASTLVQETVVVTEKEKKNKKEVINT